MKSNGLYLFEGYDPFLTNYYSNIVIIWCD